jgi:transposase InsO family protein
MGVWKTVLWLLRALVIPKGALAAENLALRQQLAVYNQSIKRPRLRPRDRVFWVWLSEFWSDWRSALVIVKPETVIHWHRQRFRLYWRWKSRRGRPGRPIIDQAPRYQIRDRDRIYGDEFRKRVESLGIEEILIAPRSPWQNPYCERLIGSIRRECVNHVIVLSEKHLKRILKSYFEYYHQARTHLSLDRNSPTPRGVQPPSHGQVVSTPQVGGLHHRYSRAA